jgi:hypothetical protein
LQSLQDGALDAHFRRPRARGKISAFDWAAVNTEPYPLLFVDERGHFPSREAWSTPHAELQSVASHGLDQHRAANGALVAVGTKLLAKIGTLPHDQRDQFTREVGNNPAIAKLFNGVNA